MMRPQDGRSGHGSGRRGFSLAVVLLLVFAAPSMLRASVELPRPSAADTVLVPTTPLESAAVAFARALASSGGDLTALLAPSGIRLHLGGTTHTGLSARQAAASLRDFLREYEGVGAVVGRAAPVDGSPVGGYAEVLLSGRMPGTSQTVLRTLFVGFVRSDGEWQVDEVRLLR